MLTFGNPLGFFALLGIPAVLAIHFLQQKSKKLEISTLFLLEQLSRESISGSRFERLRNSIPLWLQLLMVLVLAWLLVQPRWLRKDSVQRVALVVDSSASMSIYKEDLAKNLESELRDLASLVSQTEYVVLNSRLSSERLYNGTERKELIEALEDWQPIGGAHDFTAALRIARSLVGADGMLVLVSDHPHTELPFGARILSVGTPKDNCGFAGVTIEDVGNGQTVWRALIRNYGKTEQRRKWWVEADGKRTGERTIALGPGKTQTIQGPFLDGADRVTVALEEDGFALDDRLPVVLPKPKELTIYRRIDAENKKDDVYDRVFKSFKNVKMAPDSASADMALQQYDPLQPEKAPTHACIFVNDPVGAGKYMTGEIVAANHPLMQNLNWQGLLVRQSLRMPGMENDEALLWMGGKPMIFLRNHEGSRHLNFAFDLGKSNADRLPAFVVLVHRFLESIRDEKIALETLNVETGQDLEFAFDSSSEASPITLETANGETEFPLREVALVNAPLEPGFFTVRQGDTLLLDGAAHFADTREADFQSATEANTVRDAESKLVERHSRHDSWWRLWTLLLALVLLASWFFSRPASSPNTRPEPAKS